MNPSKASPLFHPAWSSATSLFYCPIPLLHFVLLYTIFTHIYMLLYNLTHINQHGTCSQPGEEPLFTEESRSTD